MYREFNIVFSELTALAALALEDEPSKTPGSSKNLITLATDYVLELLQQEVCPFPRTRVVI